MKANKKKTTKKVTKRRKRVYYGIVKIPFGTKMSWISKQDKRGWALGLALNKRTIWLTGLRLKTKSHVLSAILRSNVVFIDLKNS